MTTYVVIGGSGSTASLSLLATTRVLRIAQVDARAGAQTLSLEVFRFSGAGHSGGTVVTPVPTRQGVPTPAPAATATCRGNSSVTGTSVSFGVKAVGESGAAAPAEAVYQPTFDLLVPPGSLVRAVTSSTGGLCLIHFEELQLDWSI